MPETDRRDTSDPRSAVLVAAAHDLLDEVGLEGLTIRAVLAQTGLARRAFYERFETKDDLVLAVFASTLRQAADHFGAQVAHIAAPLDRLRAIVLGIVLGRAGFAPDSSWEHSRRSAALSREHLRLAEAMPHKLQQAIQPLVALIAHEMQAGMATGAVRRGDPQHLAALVYNLVSTTVHTELLTQETGHRSRDHREALAEEVWEFCRRAIAA